LLLAHDPVTFLYLCDPVGLWLLASDMNHSCVLNTQRSFVGDKMFVRAGSDLAAGIEPRHSNVDLIKGYWE